MMPLEKLSQGEKFTAESLAGLLNLGFAKWRVAHTIVELPLPELEMMNHSFQIEQAVFVDGGQNTIIPDTGIFVASTNFYLKYWLGFYKGFVELYGGEIWCASRHVENRGLDKTLDGKPIQGGQLAKVYDPIIVQAAANFFQLPILSSQSVHFKSNDDPEQLYWETLGYKRTRLRFESMDRIFVPGE